jgi:hypothetical protein
MKSFALFPFLLMLLTASLGAQTPNTETPNTGDNPAPAADSASKASESDGPRRFWQANVPGGNYMVAIDRISSISMQTYMLDGELVVHEVTIDTSGQALARFYYIDPPSSAVTGANLAIERGREVLDQIGKRTGNHSATMVVKKYPETTHAKCIEYRLLDIGELNALYKSLKDTWETGRGRNFTVK